MSASKESQKHIPTKNNSIDGTSLSPQLYSKNELAASKEMCIHCFNIIIQDLLQHPTLLDPSLLDAISPETECPLFVTWDKKHHSDYRLRGCIGTLAPRPLKKSIGDYAATSAFRDHRFNPIEASEVCDLRVGVSLLINYETCHDCFDWEVGVHGIIIKFYFGGRHYNGTFLPEVSQQQGWVQKETIAHLVNKAGYEGVLSNDFFAAIDCTRYQSSKQRMDYNQYKASVGKDPIGEASGDGSIHKGWNGLFQNRK